MKVTYDLSAIGYAACSDLGKTGIYRVVKSLAETLMEFEALDLQWSSFGELSNSLTARAIQGQPLSQRPLIEYGLSHQALSRLEHQIRFANTVSHAKIPGLRFFVAMLEKYQRRIETSIDLSAFKTDIWHLPSGLFPPSLLARSLNFVRFFTIYDLIAVKFPNYFIGLPTNDAVNLSSIRSEDWVLCISERTKSDLLDYRSDLDPARIRVTPLAAQPEFTPNHDEAVQQQVLMQLGIPKNAPYLLSVCTLEPRKNLRLVVRAFESFSQKNKDVYLVLVGSFGWDFESLQRELDNDISGRIIVTGFLPDAQLNSLYTGCQAFVYMSLYEGFGLPPLEAMQCGAPVICADNSSLPEVVGDAAILLDAHDLNGLVEAFMHVLNKGSVRAELREKSLKRAAEFSWQRTAELTLAVYQDAIS